MGERKTWRCISFCFVDCFGWQVEMVCDSMSLLFEHICNVTVLLFSKLTGCFNVSFLVFFPPGLEWMDSGLLDLSVF